MSIAALQQGAMSWFRAKSKDPEPHTSESSNFGSDSGSVSSFEGSTNFAAGTGRGDERAGGGGASGSLAELQAAVQAEQQRAAVQAVVSRLTDLAFTKCVQKPSSSLSSSELTCIHATVLKYFDTSEFVLGRLMKAQQGGGGGV